MESTALQSSMHVLVLAQKAVSVSEVAYQVGYLGAEVFQPTVSASFRCVAFGVRRLVK